MTNLRKIFAFVLAVMVVAGLTGSMKVSNTNAAPSNGSLVKSDTDSAVYYYEGGKLYVFPSSKVYFSWYQDFNNVMTISATELQMYPLAGNVKYRPSTKLVKTPTSNKVYVVGQNGVLSAVPSEQDAINLWGTNWASKVDDIVPSFFTNYTIGADKAAGKYGWGQLVKKNSSADIYLYNGSNYRRVTETGFNANHFNFAFVATVADSTSLTPMGTDVTMAESGLWAVAGGASSNNNGNGSTFNENGNTQGSIDTIDMGTRDESSALEGESDVEIYATDITTTDDGPLMLQRADVWFAETDTGGQSQKPWDYFTEVSLMVDGVVVDTMNADSSSDWSEVTNGSIQGATTTREYRMRFSNLEGILGSDDTTKVSVAVSMANSLDSDDQTATWNVELGSIRVLDESGFVADENDGFDSSATLEDSFSVDAADVASIDIRDASDDIDATIVEVDTDNDTNGVAIYNFTMEEQNNVDVNVEEMTLTFATTGAENTVLRRASLYMGDTKVGEESMTSNGVVAFDNMDINIDGDTEETFTVKVDIYDTNDGDRYAEGTTLSVDVTSIDKALDANDNDEADIDTSISATSNSHELRTKGIRVALVGTPTANVTAVDGDTNDIVEFAWTFDVTAFGDSDVYLNRDVADIVTSSTAGDVDQLYSIEYSTGAVLTSVSGTVTTSSGSGTVDQTITGDDTAYGAVYNGETFFKVKKGGTGRFTITVSGTNQTQSKQVRALLNNIEWTTDEVTAATAQNGSTAAINAYTFQLGSEAATPFRTIN